MGFLLYFAQIDNNIVISIYKWRKKMQNKNSNHSRYLLKWYILSITILIKIKKYSKCNAIVT